MKSVLKMLAKKMATGHRTMTSVVIVIFLTREKGVKEKEEYFKIKF